MDARTILETPRHVNVSPMGSGEMWYNGLKPVLYKLLGQQNLDEIPKISLKFHVDGLQIFKSSKVDLWPILCAIEELPNIPPQVIAIYCGNGKPSNVSEYLKEFVPEIQDLLTNGLEIDMYHIKVAIKCFLCDLPARAFLKGTVYFNHRSGCSKCTAIGENESGNRMSFPNLNAQKRTNESFRQRKNISHHRESSVIERLPVDMVKDFPISDDLHLLHQGVMKRMCSLWIAGRNNYYTKWSANDVKKVSEELVKLNLYKPKELHRQIRDLSDISRWKGTEWRTLLMYTGVVVLRNILRPDVYYNFLLLFCGVTICETSYYKFLLPVADSMLKEFVKTYIEIYGSDEIVMNIHSTIHIVDDVQNHGPLASMSTYIFENLLKDVKQCVRNGKKPLIQVARRLIEKSHVDMLKAKKTKIYPNLEKKTSEHHERNDCTGTYCILNLNKYLTFRNDNKNCWFMNSNNEIIRICNITIHNREIVIYGKKILRIKDFFTEPIKSSTLNIYCSDTMVCDMQKLYKLTDIKCKMFGMEYNTMYIFVPLVHTFNL
ncbi:uncharacterized protein LOC129791928 isoform X2 [Lutzomyia longipalpis]|nr:uncharacterized protein LOC129791928 isoform X2 [Lutzomyia longipalpis]XP_055686592.1 uncharacterized protein LOC129791928 isoform X2 [Lutzomyia longipalpis]